MKVYRYQMSRVAVALALIAALIGCAQAGLGGGGNDSGGGNPDQGAVVLRFSDVRTLTIDPDRSLEIDSYVVSFAQDGVPPVNISGIPGTATQTEPVYLDPGTWTVTVTALNDTGDIIGVGSAADVAVSAGETSSVNLSIVSLTGDGTLNLTADISELSMTAPTVSGSLLPGSGGPAIPISLDIAGNSGSFSGPIPAGSYFLQLELRDGAELLASYVDSVLIAQDLPSSGSLVFRPKVGSVEVELIDDITRPIAITFAGAQETISTTESMTVTASPSQSVDSYRWFLDGTELSGETDPAVTVGPELAVGEYELTVLVQKGAIFSSESVVFEVIEATTGGSTADWLVFAEFEQEEGYDTSIAFVHIFDRELVDLTDVSSFAEIGDILQGRTQVSDGFLSDLSSAVVSDATVTMNGVDLSFNSFRYDSELPLVAEGSDITLDVRDSGGDIVAVGRVQLAGAVQVASSVLSASPVLLPSMVLDPNGFGYELPIYERTTTWTSNLPEPQEYLVEYSVGYDLIRTSTSVASDSFVTVRNFHVPPASSDFVDAVSFLPLFEEAFGEEIQVVSYDPATGDLVLDFVFITDGLYDDIVSFEARPGFPQVSAINRTTIGGSSPATGSYLEARNSAEG